MIQWPLEKLCSITAQNKHGGNCHFGNLIPGESFYGAQVKYICQREFGVIAPGITIFGDVYEMNGIYQKRRSENGATISKMKWFVTKNPRTEPQQANRGKFGDAVDAWHNLTTEQKAVYNIESKKTRGTGFNLFIKNYMRA